MKAGAGCGYDPREDTLMAVCPECEADVEIDEYDVDKGEIISCPECGIELEVVGLAPLQLDVAPQDEEDWTE
jgi:alpha-aminoadipate carrier protein LysW